MTCCLEGNYSIQLSYGNSKSDSVFEMFHAVQVERSPSRLVHVPHMQGVGVDLSWASLCCCLVGLLVLAGGQVRLREGATHHTICAILLGEVTSQMPLRRSFLYWSRVIITCSFGLPSCTLCTAVRCPTDAGRFELPLGSSGMLHQEYPRRKPTCREESTGVRLPTTTTNQVGSSTSTPRR